MRSAQGRAHPCSTFWARKEEAARGGHFRREGTERDPVCDTAFKNFHKPVVTSNLVCQFQIGDHGRGRDGWPKPTQLVPKSFVSRILVSKLFDIRVLRGISR